MEIKSLAILASVVISAVSINASQHESLDKFHIKRESIQALLGKETNDLSVFKNADGWHVVEDGLETKVDHHDVDPILKAMESKQLEAFQNAGYIVVKRLNKENKNRKYILHALLRLQGGGPILGAFLYGATKAVCYGVGIAAGTAAIGGATAGAVALTVGTGGAAAGPLAVIGAKIGALALGAGASASLGTVGAAGAALTATAVTSTVGATAATTAVAGTAVAAGGVAGLLAMIEGAAIGMAAIGTALPTP